MRLRQREKKVDESLVDHEKLLIIKMRNCFTTFLLKKCWSLKVGLRLYLLQNFDLKLWILNIEADVEFDMLLVEFVGV